MSLSLPSGEVSTPISSDTEERTCEREGPKRVRKRDYLPGESPFVSSESVFGRSLTPELGGRTFVTSRQSREYPLESSSGKGTTRKSTRERRPVMDSLLVTHWVRSIRCVSRD